MSDDGYPHFTDTKYIYFIGQNMGNGANSLMYGVRRTMNPQDPGKPVKDYTYLKFRTGGFVDISKKIPLHYFCRREDAEKELIQMAKHKKLQPYNGYISFE